MKVLFTAWEGGSLGQFVGESVDESVGTGTIQKKTSFSALGVAWSKEMPKGRLLIS